MHGADRLFPRRDEAPRPSASATERPSTAERQINAVAPRSVNEILLAVVPVRLQAGERTIETHALLDSGSQATLLRQDAASQLGLKGLSRNVRFATFQGGEPTVSTQLVDLVVASRDGTSAYPIHGAYVVTHLNVGNRRLLGPLPSLDYYRDCIVPADSAPDVQILIGMDVQDAHVPVQVRRPPPGTSGPNALLTPFGWCLVGRHPTADTTRAGQGPQVNNIQVDRVQELERAVEQFWCTQSIPVCVAPKTFMAPDDKAALEHMEATIRHDGERYEVGLPVRESAPPLPDNREAARRSFLSLERRLRADDVLRRGVVAVVMDTIRSGHAVKATDPGRPGRTWYLPYHAVRNPNKPQKVRVVFNAAARHRGVALNDVLRKGPDLTTQLLAVLLRFRERLIAVSADIRKMFYQVRVPVEDRALFRFWWREPCSQAPIEPFEMTVHVFGAVSSPSICSFALRHLMRDPPHELREVASRIASDFYVDNLLASFDHEEAASSTCEKLVQLLAAGGFELAQFLSSSRAVLGKLPVVARLNPELDMDLDGLPTERTLGYLWNCQIDAFVFRLQPKPEAETKRAILAAVSSIYDPLGLVAPVVLTAKIMLQDIWRLKLDWDDEVPAEILTRWRKWTEEVPALEQITVKRNHLERPPRFYRSIQLHAFADASQDGFGAVLYLRLDSEAGVRVTFVMAKARVAPIHQLSVPRLELQAALMSTRLVSFFLSETTLPIHAIFFWSDAMTVLRWLNSSHRRYVAFVANRVAEILETSEISQWRHVPGLLNPADELSRGLFPSHLDAEHRWFSGPTFLALPSEDWPSTAVPHDETCEGEWIGVLEVRAATRPVDELIGRSGNLHRLIRITAWVNRFIGNVRARIRRRRDCKQSIAEEPAKAPGVGRKQSAGELKSARLTLLRVAQSADFPDELYRLRSGRQIQRESRLLTLSPFIDARQLLRVGGRLQNSVLQYDARHPIVLDPHHPLSRLLLRWAHLCVNHGRADRTLAEVRTRYWMLRGREAVKSTITSCLVCARDRARPPQPLMAPLPESRVRPFQRPFTSTGIDYFGPYSVSIGRRSEKRYGVVFTCLATRAVHLELATSLDADSFLLAFSRFVSRRFAPAEVWSDNGTNLRAGERELREAVGRLNEGRIPEQLARQEIRWHFSPPSAPHFGGVWERLVRSCKTAIDAVIGPKTVKEEVLGTVFAQVEALLNNRPLTYLADHPEELEPLTPNHFLAGGPNPHIPADVVLPTETCFRRRWRHAQQLVDQVWQRWLREYLPTLNTRKKWAQDKMSLKVDDVVLLVDPNSPRGHWQLGRIIRTIPGPDGIVRTAEVTTRKGAYVRPVARLCRLESFNAA